MYDGSVIGRTRSAIIGLLLLLATWRNNDSCNGLQYQPLEIYANGEECALILDGPGRTSAFDYTYNLLRGSFPPSVGSHQTCITYDAVNHAYIEARKRINVAQPKNGMWRPEDLATVGELLLDISSNLAHTYGLSYEDIEKSLPLIDTSKTLIREVCPAFLSNVECRPGKYRRYDGLCTNLQNPTWGATLSPFTRLLSPRFADGLTAPRISITGRDLPLSRVVSRTMHPDEGYHDHAGTVMVIAWGQFMDHDYTLTGTPLDPLNRNDPEECCSRPPHLKNPYCNEILIPEDDYFYRLFGVKCMDFVRAFPAVRPGCRLGSRVPFNLLTGVLDGNTVYGITEAFARKLRTGYGGLLRMNPVFSDYGLKDLLPLKLDIPDEGCTRPNRSMYCFEAGEIRVNEQLVLTCMHTLLAREHNRLAKGLNQVNPHWDDETLFQEARRIVIAEIQHITYNEFLPILLGKDVMEKFGLLLEKNRYWDGYDESVNPGVIDAFASAAFRFGHSLLPTAVERWSKAHKFIASKRLSDLIRRPYDLYRAGVFDEYIMGLMNQVAQAMDDSITQEVTNHLFKKVGAKFGLDLVSFNMQRGREFGIPSYMEFRKFCGLPGADSFEELFGSMPNETIRRYSSIFEHPSDVDLWSGGVSERPLPGSMLGPTFACVIATQFSYSRRGDRFWYELPNQPSSFTLEQLNEIRKAKLARLICDNTDLIDTIQIYPMVLPDHEINPRVPCRSGILPGIDLSKWAEFPTTNHGAQYNQINAEATEFAGNKSSSPVTKLFIPEWKSIDKSSRKAKKLEKIRIKYAKDKKKISRDKTPVNDQNPDNEEIIKITTIVETIRRKNERNADMLAKSNAKRKEIDIKRTKRSLNDSNSNSSDHVDTKKQISTPDGFYRHPKLTYEEQARQLREITKATNNSNSSSKSTHTNPREFYKRIWDIIDDTQEKFKTILPPKQSKKHNYLPVFPDCNKTEDNSEVHDLNKPVPSKNLNLQPDNIENKKNEKLLHTSETSANDNHSKEKHEGTPQPRYTEQDYSTASTSLEEQQKNKIYINLQDHQRAAEQTTSTDNPPYNPDNIPYVEVPDYSDVREESLDEEDRRANKENGKYEDTDVIDPEISTDDEKTSKSSNVNESNLSDDDETSDEERSMKGSIVDSVIENQDAARELEDNVSDKVRDYYSDRKEHVSAEEPVDKGERESEETLERVEKKNSKVVFEPVTFDIKEYTKPFNLEDFLKNDPILKRLNAENSEVYANYEKNEKGTPVNSDETKNDEIYKSHSVEEDDSKEDDDFDYLPKSTHSENSNVKFKKTDDDDLDRDEDKENVESQKGTDDSDDDFLKSFFKRHEKKSSSRPFESEDDFLSKYFTDDIITKLKEDEDDAETRTEKQTKYKDDDRYKTLSAILSKKDHVSRLNEDIDKKIKDGQQPPLTYKNFWSLEYKSPDKKPTSESEEKE